MPELGLVRKEYRISFLFSGENTAIKLTAGETPLKISYADGGDDIFSPIRAKKATIQLIATSNVDLGTFYSESDRECMVVITEGFKTIFRGWLTAFDAREPFISLPYPFEVVAHCGLSSLKDFNFSETGLISFNTAIKQCLAATGLSLNYQVGIDTRISGDTGDPTTLYGFEADALNGKSCYDALTSILDAFVADVEQSEGQFIIRGVSEQANGLVNTYEYTSAGAAVQMSNTAAVVNVGRGAQRRNVTGAEMQREPAISYVEIKYDLGKLRNLLSNGSFTEQPILAPILGQYSYTDWTRYNGIVGSKESPSGVKIQGRSKMWFKNADGTIVKDQNGKIPFDLRAQFGENYPLFMDDKYYESDPIQLQSAQKIVLKGRFQSKYIDYARLEVYLYDPARPTEKLWLTKEGEWKETRSFVMLDYTPQVIRVYDDLVLQVWFPFEITSQDVPTKRSASTSIDWGASPFTSIEYYELKVRVFRGAYNNGALGLSSTGTDEEAFVIYDGLAVNFNSKNENDLILTYGFKNGNYVRKNKLNVTVPFGGRSVRISTTEILKREASLNNYTSVIRRMDGADIVDAWTKAGQGVVTDFIRLNGISRLRLGHRFGYSWDGDIVGEYFDGTNRVVLTAVGRTFKVTKYEYDFKRRIASVTLKQLIAGNFSYVEALQEGSASGSSSTVSGGAIATTITNGNIKPTAADKNAFTDRGLIKDPIDFDTVMDNGEYRVDVPSGTWTGFLHAPIFALPFGRLRVFETEGVVMQYYYPENGGVHWREYSYSELAQEIIWQPEGGWYIAAEGNMLAETLDDEPDPQSIKVVDFYNRGIGSGMEVDVPTLSAFNKQGLDAFIDRSGINDPIEITSPSNFNTFTADGSDYLVSLTTWEDSTNAPTGLPVGGRLTVEKIDGAIYQKYQSGSSILSRTRLKKNLNGTYTWTAWIVDTTSTPQTFVNDFDLMVDMGAYHIATATMPDNAPPNAVVGGMLHVFVTDGELQQRYYQNKKIYLRSRLGGAWTLWEQGVEGVTFDTEAIPLPDTVKVATEYIDGVAVGPTVFVYTKDYIDDLTTTDIPEPSTDIINKYFTNERARNAISAGIGLSYDPVTGVISYTGATNPISAVPPLYHNSTTGAFSWGGTTADVPEQSPYLYFTETRARAAFSAGTGIAIVNGVISVTGGEYSDAQARAAISVAGGVLSYNSTTGVITLLDSAYDGRFVLLSGSYTNPSWLVSLPWSKITGTPTTLAGYGIGNAYTKTEVDTLISNISQLPSGGTASTYLRGDKVWATLNTAAVVESTNLYFTTARARDAFSAGTGINIGVGGVISSTITQYTDAQARASISAGTGITYNASTGVITSTITQYTDAMARGAFSAGTGIAISVNGVISSLITQYTDTQARAALSAGTGISYNSVTGVITSTITQYTDAQARGAFSAGAGINIGVGGVISSLITQYTDTMARAAISGGTGITYNSTTGVIASSITQYTDALARAAISVSGGVLTYSITTGVITLSSSAYDGRYVQLAGAYVNPTWIVSLPWAKITGTPTTLAGYGITNAYTKTEVDGLINGITGLPSGGTVNDYLRGDKTWAVLDTQAVVESPIRLYFTNARARAALSAGTGLTYNSTTGQFASSITQYTDALARAAISAGTGIGYNNTTGVISSTITQYTDAMARAALSAGAGISYNSTTGVIASTITQYTDALARAALSAGVGISYNSTTGVISSTITQYTDALARGAFSAGTGISISAGGVITSTITQYTDALARGAFSAGTGINISPTGVISATNTGTIGGSGTTSYVPKWTGGTSLGNSQIYDNGSGVVIGGTDPSSYKFRVNGAIYSDGDGASVAMYIGAGRAIRSLGEMYIDSPGGNTYFRNGAGYAYSLTLNPSGYVLMGTVTAVGTKTLQVNGGIRATGQMQFANYTSSSSYTGSRSGLLGFNSSGDIITVADSDFSFAGHTHDDRYYTKTQLNTSGGGGVVHWDNVSNKPSTFTPSAHSHVISDVSGLSSELAGKASVSHNHDGYHVRISTGDTVTGYHNFINGFSVNSIDSSTRFLVKSSNAGTQTVNNNVNVNGDLYCSGNVTAYSDARLKDDVTAITNALDKIVQIGGYDFTWNEESGKSGQRDVGVIAQEIEAILPNVVKDVDGYKSVDYGRIVPLLIEGIKELYTELKAK